MCLNQNESDNSRCREQSKDYLECRMEKGLMAKEGWDALGFSDMETKKS